MYVLYLDESGVHSSAKYFVLAGLAVFERDIYWYTEDVEALQKRYFPDVSDPVQFHATTLRAPKEHTPPPFDRFSQEEKRQILTDILNVIRGRHGVLFASVIEKAWLRMGEDAYERAFEDLISRFDRFLIRIRGNQTFITDEQRGLLVVSASAYQERLEVLGRKFRGGSTRWGSIHAIAEVPFFVPTGNTRMLQLADFYANAIYGYYNAGHATDFQIISPRFDNEQGCIHGLSHLTRDHECTCMACVSRRIRSYQHSD